MFVGKSIHTLGKDGRISIPSKMRDIFINKFGSDEVYMVLWFDDTLCLFPSKEFEEIAEKLGNLSEESIDDITENMKRAADLFSEAENSKIDGSGRIMIPLEMQKAAQIEQDVLIIGAKNHVQLWNPVVWQRERKNRGHTTSANISKTSKAKSTAA
jgi:MraZ protein